MPSESYRRRLMPLFLYLFYVFGALINSLERKLTPLCVDSARTFLFLHACQVRVTVGDSGLCCCTCVTYLPCVSILHERSGPRSVSNLTLGSEDLFNRTALVGCSKSVINGHD